LKAVHNIEKNNHITPIHPWKHGKNAIKSINAVFTNCTYNAVETESHFDLICISNYVKLEKEINAPTICSIEHLNYIECTQDNEHPEKCNISNAIMLFYLYPILYFFIYYNHNGFIIFISFLNFLFKIDTFLNTILNIQNKI